MQPPESSHTVEDLLRHPKSREYLLAKLTGREIEELTFDFSEDQGPDSSADRIPTSRTRKLDSVWQLLLEPVAEAIADRLSDNSLLPIFLLENPYPAYGSALIDALEQNPVLDGFKVINLGEEKIYSLSNHVVALAGKPPRGVILFCTSRSQLPRDFRSVVRQDGYLTIPAFTFERLQHFAERQRPGLQLSEAARSWVRWIGPQELIVAETLSDAHWEQGLGQLAKQRLGVQVIGTPRKLDELYGVDTARNWARQLFNDIALARDGKISWREVDRGALLIGPPGTGKTTLARAIAYEAGTNFIAVSPVKDWMTGDGLDESIKLMSATFSAARQQAPSIIFIDEIDSVGNRENFSGQNASWNTAFLNALLTELDGFEERDQIIVLAATNYVDNVDAALRRAGRLDRVIRLERPSADALAAMYKGMLGKYPHTLDEVALHECAANSLGLTGADLEVLIRGARRRARLDGNRPILASDILDEIYSIPSDAERLPVKSEALNTTAYHEAGHALAGLLLDTLKDQVRLASIIPNNDGALGFVALAGNGSNETRESLLDRICMALAGRASEELVFGADRVSTGAGGSSTQNDLALARRIAEAFVGIYGFSTVHPNWWNDTDTDSVQETQALIAMQFARARDLLEKNRATLDRLAASLTAEYVMPREKLLACIAAS